MQTQRRKLTIQMAGEDVALLQLNLRQLGLAIADEKGSFGESTLQAVQSFQRQHDLNPTGEVNVDTAARIATALSASHRVQGLVSQEDGVPLPGITVEAFARNLHIETLLGEDTTDRFGHYVIHYSGQPDGRTTDLIVRVTDPKALGKVLAESPLITEPPIELTVDLTVSDKTCRAPSEYERLSENSSRYSKALNRES
jgi:peptidoglycan hydrolase-like protein with peptidoglycan-binding domain